MGAEEVLEDLRDRGYTVTVRGGRLKLRGPCRPLEDVERRIASCREELIAAVSAPPIEYAAEVLALARERFAPVEDPVTPPTLPGRDPMAKRHTDKAEFFKGVWREAWPRDFRVYEGGAG